jgi:hypothetical protein
MNNYQSPVSLKGSLPKNSRSPIMRVSEKRGGLNASLDYTQSHIQQQQKGMKRDISN